MREMLFGSEVSQSSHAGPGHAAVVREGTICMFDDKQQEYGIMWQEANQVDQDMTFVSLAMLLFFLVDPGKKRIVRSMQELIRRSNSNVFNRTTSPENASTESPKKKQKKSSVSSQPPTKTRGLTKSDETVHQPPAKQSRKPPKKPPKKPSTNTLKTSPKPSPTKTTKSVKPNNQTIKLQTKSMDLCALFSQTTGTNCGYEPRISSSSSRGEVLTRAHHRKGSLHRSAEKGFCCISSRSCGYRI